MSLRSRIALIAAALVLAAVLVSTLLQTFAARWAVLEQARESGNTVAEMLARAVSFAEAAPRSGPVVGVPGGDQPQPVESGTASLAKLEQNPGLQRLVDELVTGRQEGGRRVAGDVREVRILGPQLATLVSRRSDAAGVLSDAPPALNGPDAVLARDCIANKTPAGRFVGGFYRVAAPVRRHDGRPAGAVLVEISTESSRAALGWQVAAAVATALLVGLPAVLAAVWLAKSIADPVQQVVSVAESIADGDLTPRVKVAGPREVGRMLTAFSRMTGSLGGLIGRIQAAGERLTHVEADAAAALALQDRTIRGFSGSAQDISAAVAEISATSEHLLDATSSVKEVAHEAARVADEGRDGLESMTTSMHQLDEAMNAFTRKLSTISQRAAGITAVVTTIAKVADQTNLLSVNATIEAEKAGESGRGFRIVAQEIRRLADQTALATKDIERMVRDMQTAVSSGTMEMDRFRNEVSQRIREVAGVSEKLGRIIEPVQSVTESLDHVHEGMQTQSQGARQIRDAMDSLRSGAGESAASLAVFAGALDDLRRSIVELNTEAASFRTVAAAADGPAATAVG